MTDVTIYGIAPSSYTRTARMIAREKGIDYRFEQVELKSPAHLALHPWGRVPILEHGGIRLFETAAIGRYLDTIGNGPKLVPDDPVRAARMEQWISVVNCYAYENLVTKYLFAYLFPKTPDQRPDRDAIARHFPNVERDLRKVEHGFEGEWLTGNTITLADLFLAPLLASIGQLPEAAAVLETCPNLRRAYHLLCERPSFRDAVPTQG